MTQDTDVMVLALRRLPLLGPKTMMILGTGEHRRKISLKPIYDKLCPEKVAALPAFHCLTGCDTCGHIQGKGKKSAFKVFSEMSSDVCATLSQLGKQEVPSADVISGCEQFLCMLMSSKASSAKSAGELR